jgi:hypothetical protein
MYYFVPNITIVKKQNQYRMRFHFLKSFTNYNFLLK